MPRSSTVTHIELVGHVTALRLCVESMLCLVAVASPVPETARLRILPTLSTATHDVVDVHTIPFSALPSTLVAFHVSDSIWVVLVAMCTLPTLSAAAQKDEERQCTLFIAALVLKPSAYHDVDAGVVE
jgi:hypothetical protein